MHALDNQMHFNILGGDGFRSSFQFLQMARKKKQLN